MKKRMLMLAAAAALTGARADVVQSLGNARTGMVVNEDRADWAGAVAFVEDTTNEPGIGPFDVDWLRATFAHAADAELLCVRYETDRGADFGLYPAFYNLYIDTDLSRGTGYIGGGGQLSVGADFLIQGASVFQFTGAGQMDFSWSYVGVGSYDNSYTNHDLEMGFAPSLLGSPTSFNFVVLADNALNGNTQDYYPDSGSGGAGGGYFAYAFTALTTQPVLRAASIGTATAIVFESRAGARYQLHYKTNVLDAGWTYTGLEVDGTGGTMQLFDPTGYSAAKLYRVRVP